MTFFSSITQSASIYLYDTFGNIPAYYDLNQFGGLKQINIAPTITLKPITTLDNLSIYLNSLAQIHQEYKDSIKVICARLGCPLPAKTEFISRAFTEWLKINKYSQIQSLDLSDLGLKILPPQMSLFTELEELNLKNNDLRLLPPELQSLPLKKINISNNKRLQPNIPSWIGKKDLKCIAYGIDLCFLPEGTNPDQFECEWDLNLIRPS